MPDDLRALAQAMADAIEAHRHTRSRSRVGRDGRTRYGAADLEADLALDAAERAYREATQQPWKWMPDA